MYIPAGHNLVDIVNLLNQEYALTQNVKSKTVRKNVLSALTKIMQHLKLFRVTPKNGLVIFCGNVSQREGVSDIKLWSIEPPEPLVYKIYRCDQRFVLDPLKEMLREKEIYGLIVLDAGSAEIGLLKGKKIEKLKHLESVVPSKTVKGGMCVYENDGVYLTNGKTKIKNIRKTDEVLSFSFEKNRFVVKNPSCIMKRKAKEAYRIVTELATITLTPQHIVFVNNGKITEKFAGELKIGEKLFYVKNRKIFCIPIKEIEKIYANAFFYDLEIPETHNFVVNGIIVHNSQARYDRLRAEEIMKFLKKVGETASEFFLQEKDLKGVLIGGPGPVKEELPKGEYLHYQIKQKVLGVVDTSYTEEQGLQELVVRGEHLIQQASIVKEKRLLNEFFKHLQKDDGLAVYGIEEVEKALNYGALETLIISDEFDWLRVSYKCSSCGFPLKKNVKPKQKFQKCPKCKIELTIEEETDLSEYFIEKAKEVGSKVEIVSVETREGAQFKELGGIGGILRFKSELLLA